MDHKAASGKKMQLWAPYRNLIGSTIADVRWDVPSLFVELPFSGFCFLFFDPSSWEAGQGVSGWRGGPCPFALWLVFVECSWRFLHGPITGTRVSLVSLAQRALPQLNGPVQLLVFSPHSDLSTDRVDVTNRQQREKTAKNRLFILSRTISANYMETVIRELLVRSEDDLELCADNKDLFLETMENIVREYDIPGLSPTYGAGWTWKVDLNSL